MLVEDFCPACMKVVECVCESTDGVMGTWKCLECGEVVFYDWITDDV